MIERLAPLLFSMIGKDLAVTVRQVKRNTLLYLIAVLFFLTAYIAVVFGLFLLLADRFGDVAATFAVAVGSLILAIAILIAVVLVDRAERRRPKSQAFDTGLLAIGAASLLPVVLKSRTLTGLATLGVIAFLASRVPPAPGDGHKS
jgi:MFS family permease